MLFFHVERIVEPVTPMGATTPPCIGAKIEHAQDEEAAACCEVRLHPRLSPEALLDFSTDPL